MSRKKLKGQRCRYENLATPRPQHQVRVSAKASVVAEVREHLEVADAAKCVDPTCFELDRGEYDIWFDWNRYYDIGPDRDEVTLRDLPEHFQGASYGQINHPITTRPEGQMDRRNNRHPEARDR